MTKAKQDFSLPIVVFCEEVRKEITYKDTILGAVPDGMGLTSFPASIRFALWATVDTFEFEKGTHQIVFSFTKTKSSMKIFHETSIKFLFDPSGSSRFAVHTPVDFLRLNEPCELFLWYSLDNRKRVFIQKIAFEQIDTSTLEFDQS